MAEEFNHFAELARKMHTAASQIVRKTAFDIEAGAKQRAPVDTGFLRSSIYVETSNSSDYGQTEGKGELLPEVEAPADDQTALIAVGTNYGIFLEYGTVHMTAKPYLTPAAEAVRPAFESAMQQLEDKMKA